MSVNINTSTNNITINNSDRVITVNDNNQSTSVNITQPITDIVAITTVGPQGPVGPPGPVGPMPTFNTSSLATTGSNNFVGNQTVTGSVTATLGFTGSLFGTASFATTSSFPWNITGSNISYINGNVGIGTNNPIANLDIYSSASNSSFRLAGNAGVFASIYRYSNNTTRPRYEMYKARGTDSAPLVIQSNDELGSIDFHGYDGTAFQRNAIVLVQALNVSSSIITPRYLIGLGPNAGSNNYFFSLTSTGTVLADNASAISPSAKLHVRGSGSASTTTALRVENSTANPSLVVTDDSNVSIGGIINSTGFGQKLRIIGQGDAAIGIYRNQASSSPAKIEFMKSRGTYDVPLVVNNLDELGSLGYFGFNGTSYSNSARVYARAVSSTGTGVEGELLTTLWNNTGGNLNMLRLTINGLGIGNALDYAPSARLHVRSSGATASTTALRVENSSATPSLVVLDNSFVGIGTATPSASLQVRGSGSSASTTAFRVENSNFSASLVVLDDIRVGIGTTTPSFTLDVSGSVRFTNGLTVTGSLNVTNGITGSLLGTSSFAITASYALNTISETLAIAYAIALG